MSEENQKPNVPTRGKAPVFANGLTTDKTYLIVGVRNGEEFYNAVGVRNCGGGEYKLHFWPNAETFGVKKDNELGLHLYDRAEAGRSRGPYQGAVTDWEGLSGLIDHLATIPGTSVAPKDRVVEELKIGFNSERHFTA